ARQAHNLKVTGSNPVPATKIRKASAHKAEAFLHANTPMIAAGESLPKPPDNSGQGQRRTARLPEAVPRLYDVGKGG
ncbi:hypothetical protein, partial [Chelatococcus asaccharovorans]|uniref:hypothetical protein n=1 Tax=Chelatococcus asaccharovorans TaxID=28210 RepID=UPI001AECFF67